MSVAYAACLWRLRTLSFLPPTRLIYSPQPSAARASSCAADSSNCEKPCMRFMFFGPEVCLGLPSDSTSRWTPLPSATATAAFTAQDLHLVDNAHAGHTKRSTRTEKAPVRSPAYVIPNERSEEGSRVGFVGKAGAWKLNLETQSSTQVQIPPPCGRLG